jgi:hypothetical protein
VQCCSIYQTECQWKGIEVNGEVYESGAWEGCSNTVEILKLVLFRVYSVGLFVRKGSREAGRDCGSFESALGINWL